MLPCCIKALISLKEKILTDHKPMNDSICWMLGVTMFLLIKNTSVYINVKSKQVNANQKSRIHQRLETLPLWEHPQQTPVIEHDSQST